MGWILVRWSFLRVYDMMDGSVKWTRRLVVGYQFHLRKTISFNQETDLGNQTWNTTIKSIDMGRMLSLMLDVLWSIISCYAMFRYVVIYAFFFLDQTVKYYSPFKAWKPSA